MKKGAILLLLAVLSACSDHDDKHPRPMQLYSPNGEPLNGGPLGRPTCEQATGGWFDRLSAGGNGHISELAFINDARTQFHRMDIDHNGYIVSEELDRFRAPYRLPEVRAAADKEDKEDGKEDGKHEGKHKSKSEPASEPSLSLSDPVMSADTNLDFKVTEDEFMKQAHDNYAKLDTNHDGQLTREEVLTTCKDKKDKD